MPYLVLPRRKSKFCLRENRKLAKPKFMFYQSLTRIWHNLQVHVESQIKNLKFFHIAETSKIALIGLLLSNRVLSKNTQTTQIFKWCAPPYILWLIQYDSYWWLIRQVQRRLKCLVLWQTVISVIIRIRI